MSFLLFAMGFVGVGILNSAIVLASGSPRRSLYYILGTTLGAFVGMVYGGKFK